VPATYAEAFEVLGEAGILSAAQQAAMVRMAKFRNVIVHDYARVDPEIVVGILREHLGDFAGFRAVVLGSV
jgi:uncharacterized protein YutE (UPF0331/DUF86 family)